MAIVYTTGTAVTSGPASSSPKLYGPMYKPYRESVGKNREATYLVLNCPSEAECRVFCALEIPYYGADPIVILFRPVIGAQILDYFEITEQINDTTWKVTAHYKVPEWTALPQPKISFDTMGGTTHVKHSILTKNVYGTALTKTGLIDFQLYPQTPPRGADIFEPAFQWSESQYFTQDYVTQSYIAGIAALTDCYNQATFRGYAIGEVLFLGATGGINGKRTDPNAYWEIVFHFARKPTRTNQSIPSDGSGVTGVNAYGWDLIWPLYGPLLTDNTQKIISVFVEQVYFPGDFGVLGIGS